MTWSAQFEVTEVEGTQITAKASTKPSTADQHEVGTLTQNTERAVRMELRIELEEGTETRIKVGDAIPAHGHFTS